MDFEFSKEELAFRAEAAKYIEEHGAKPGVAHYDNYGARYVDTPARRGFMKALAKKGYLGMAWPKEYGGKGLSNAYDYLLNEELALQGMPMSGKGIGIIGRTLMLRGTDEQKRKFLTPILNADIEWAIGYSEPEAGSDLASLKLKAVRDGDGWRLNGQKRFNTSTHFADWYFLAARTDFEVPKHKGITLFLIDLKNTPGIQVNAMPCIDGERTNEVFLDDVWVPDSQVIGAPGMGFTYISQALDFERHILHPVGIIERMYNAFVDWVKTAKRDGKPVREDPDVRRTLAKVTVALEVTRLLSLKVLVTKDLAKATVYSAQIKICHTEFEHLLADGALDVMGVGSWLRHSAPEAPADGLFDLIRRTAVLATVGAGSSEIQRNIIARRGLGLPNPT